VSECCADTPWSSRDAARLLDRALLPGPALARPPPTVCPEPPDRLALELPRPALCDAPDAPAALAGRRPPLQRPAAAAVAAHDPGQARARAGPDARQGRRAPLARVARRPRPHPGPHRHAARDQLDPHPRGVRPAEPGQGRPGRTARRRQARGRQAAALEGVCRVRILSLHHSVCVV
jgi:hypothetical protein